LDFKNAVEFCAVRKMELMAFDTALEAKNSQWSDKKYLKSQLSDEDLRKVEILFYMSNLMVILVTTAAIWTSGVACSTKDPGKAKGKCKTVTWCSTKTVSKLNYTLHAKKKGENCLALDLKTKKLVVSNCKNKGIVFCEVN